MLIIVKVGLLGFLKMQFVAKYQKTEGDPLETFEKFEKNSHKAEKGKSKSAGKC